MLSFVLHGIVWYCMELICILRYRIDFKFNCMVLHGILLYLTVLHCWLPRAGSQDFYLLYIINAESFQAQNFP